MPDGPATRPITPLAVENGVGKPAAPEKGAPNAGLGKRARSSSSNNGAPTLIGSNHGGEGQEPQG